MLGAGALPIALLLVLVGVGGWWDFRTRRIPNWLTLPGLLTGLIVSALSRDEGWKSGLLGVLVALCVYIPLYAIRAMGAGDVKLMAAVGALAGPDDWLVIFLATAIVGGAAALILIALRGRYYETLFNVSMLVTDLLHFRAPYQSNVSLDVRSPHALRMPHGVSIASGTVVALIYLHFRLI